MDGESLAMPSRRIVKDNLYKIWNRMSSGSYFPPPVRLVEIPKGDGGMRPLGIPTVADQSGADGREDGAGAESGASCSTRRLLCAIDPARSALDAVGSGTGSGAGAADWVVDLDIKAFFDSLDHDLVERAVAHHTDEPWVRLYIGRWLRSPRRRGRMGPWSRGPSGTPQGGRRESACWPTCSCTMRSMPG